MRPSWIPLIFMVMSCSSGARPTSEEPRKSGSDSSPPAFSGGAAPNPAPSSGEIAGRVEVPSPIVSSAPSASASPQGIPPRPVLARQIAELTLKMRTPCERPGVMIEAPPNERVLPAYLGGLIRAHGEVFGGDVPIGKVSFERIRVRSGKEKEALFLTKSRVLVGMFCEQPAACSRLWHLVNSDSQVAGYSICDVPNWGESVATITPIERGRATDVELDVQWVHLCGLAEFGQGWGEKPLGTLRKCARQTSCAGVNRCMGGGSWTGPGAPPVDL